MSPFPTHLTAACALNAFVAHAALGQYMMLQSLMGICAFKNNPTIKERLLTQASVPAALLVFKKVSPVRTAPVSAKRRNDPPLPVVATPLSVNATPDCRKENTCFG